MTKEQYHHGDLRRSLIEKGLEIINQEGEEKLSLRKVAMECGVSNAAPYAHFKNKDEFIVAIQQHIMDLFTDSLEKTAEQYKDSDSLLPMLGKSYVMFFYKNPLYFDFLFSRKNIRIQLSLSVSDENENPPLNILKKTAVSIFKKANISEKSMQDKIIAMWALVQGLSSIVTMPNVEYDDDWEVRIEEIIKSIAICYK
ncbi:MAG: TetR/AcrR family transcriptional regulator [Clostridium sp.]|nr:TetR/AcrR family transcriptional regulator [Clostridium sp.]